MSQSPRPETRTCRTCDASLPIGEFERASWVDREGVRRYSLRRSCRDCRRAYRYRWVLEHPENVREWTERRRKRGDVPSRIRDRRARRREREETFQVVKAIIRSLRGRGYTDVAIARAAGIQRQTIANWARLEAPPRAWQRRAVRRLCDAYVAIGGA
jgi:hypothetical protein